MTFANTHSARPEWRNARRITVKIGSALLTDRATGTLKQSWLEAMGDDVAALKADGRDVILVSSGAIALGRRALGLNPGPLRLEEAQAAASVGQINLAHAYQTVFRERGLTTAQILVTLGDTEERRRYLNARNTIETLLKLGAIPVVNENDTVATSEIRYGDNDRLAARVASMMTADCLVLLVRHRRALHGAARAGSRRQAARCDNGDHARDRGHGRRSWHGAVSRRNDYQADRGQDCGCRRHAHGHHDRQGLASACARLAKVRPAPGFSQPPIPSPHASAGSPARWSRKASS